MHEFSRKSWNGERVFADARNQADYVEVDAKEKVKCMIQRMQDILTVQHTETQPRAQKGQVQVNSRFVSGGRH